MDSELASAHDTTGQGQNAKDRQPGISRLAGRAVRLAAVLSFVAAAIVVAGFLYFVDQVADITPPTELTRGDAIVALTGGSNRIDQALDLLESGAGKRLLISGVNPVTSEKAIRNWTNRSEALFDCCVDIGYDAIDTIGNANETARWIKSMGYHRVLLVTNNYHMPRSLLELQRVDRDTEIIPYPVVVTDLKTEPWYRMPRVVKALVFEYAKYSAARVRNIFGNFGGSGLRTDLVAADTPEVVRAGASR